MLLGMMNILADGGDHWGSFWEPVSASTVAPEVDALFYGILWTCVFFFVLITVLLVAFSIKYRYRPGYLPSPGPKHNTAAELTWTFVPTVIVTIIFVYGFKDFMHMAVPPPDPYEVVVTAHMWSYNFTYPNQHLDDVLHIPIDIPVQLVLNSVDVIHGFSMPVFRVKKDVVPGRYNKIWVQATQLGTYDIFCTQYCGQGHSKMRAQVVVQPLDDFKKWLADASVLKGTPVEIGQILYKTRGCNQCHSVDGSIIRAPSWKDVFGSTITFKDGTSEVADENYLHGVITKPNSKPIPGFDPIMPATIDAGLLTEQEVPDLIAYIKTLSVHYHPSALPETAPATQPAK
jgi:cytochrome c oxidase subunit II